MTPEFDEAFWNDLYGTAPIWSGDANPHLVEVAEPLPAGSALDIGSGEGGDATWLARRGWSVLAVDLSTVALKRAQDAIASVPEAAARVTWQQIDLLAWTPPAASFDLVSAQYMHLHTADMRSLVERLAAAVRTGGTLLVVGHSDQEHRTAAGEHGHGHDDASADDPADSLADEAGRPTFDADLFYTAESLAELLSPADWAIVQAGPRAHPKRHGTDAVLEARRL